MKYQIQKEKIPQHMRKKINTKIEFIINQNLPESKTNITKDDIFQAYTGKGGLHGLTFTDYDSYHTYQKAKSEIEQGQFFTPYELADWIHRCLRIQDTDLVADLTCGHGAFINSTPAEQNFYGCEIDPSAYRVAKYLYPEAKLTLNDIRFYEPDVTFDYVIGNPPYHLEWKNDGESYSSELYYCLKAARLLKPGGILAVIVPQSFLADEFSDSGQIECINERFHFLCQVALNPDTFSQLGVTNYHTKVLFLQKKSVHIQGQPYRTELLDSVDAGAVWNHYLEEPTRLRAEQKQRIYLESIKLDSEKRKWNEKATKLLYDIKRHPLTRKYWAECAEYLHRYQTQAKPDYITWKEWESVQIKDYQVLNFFKECLAKQNPVPNQAGRWIKDRYQVRYNQETFRISDLVTGWKEISGLDPGLSKLLQRKQKMYQVQEQRFSEMKEDPNIAQWLDFFTLEDAGEIIRLNNHQKSDINCFLQKPYSFIQWEQGSGKTLAGIAIGKYRLEHKQARNVFVASTAISIRNNWQDILEQYGIDFCKVDTIADIEKIRDGQFVILTFGMVQKYQKQLKSFMKRQCQKILLVLDESDAMGNLDSKRTKAVLNVFRRLRYKVLMTGTSTRNTINEIYPQLELLYNNSYNMLCQAEEICEVKENMDIERKENDWYYQPYPAYHKGYKLFTVCHSPQKVTVFGQLQNTQNVYSADALKHMIDKTIITRTFEEMTGRRIYEVKHVPCVMGEAEKQVYQIALEEFYKLEYLFSKTGNAKKDSMLKIINQILTLLRICAAPQTLNEYDDSILPEKFRKVFSILDENPKEYVAIGVRHVAVVRAYEQEIRIRYPERPLFVITGNETTLRQRKEIVRKFQNSGNGILLSTQQSLSASMNIDFVNVCILPELHWNNSSMSQYYFRFIRYTSTSFKRVYFVTYDCSIETNLMEMILRKDKLNRFMKNQEVEDAEIYEAFGMEPILLSSFMYKEQTEQGFRIRWGDQDIQ